MRDNVDNEYRYLLNVFEKFSVEPLTKESFIDSI